MKTLVLGAGGIGGYFAARLAQAGVPVDVLVRPARAQVLRSAGLRLFSPLGDAHVHPGVVTASEVTADYGLVLLSCKAYDLDSAMDAIAPAVEKGALVLPMLNGLAHLERLDVRFGRAAVLGGVAHLSVGLEADGAIRHFNTLNRMEAGARDPAAAEEAHRRFAALAQCPIDFVEEADIEGRMWNKLVFLATLAGATCALRASVGSILATRDGEALVLRMFEECQRVAMAAGHAPDPRAMAAYRKTLTERGSELKASMLRDVERGGPTEGDHILGDLVRRAERLDVDVPLLRFAYAHLQAYERSRGAVTG